MRTGGLPSCIECTDMPILRALERARVAVIFKGQLDYEL